MPIDIAGVNIEGILYLVGAVYLLFNFPNSDRYYVFRILIIFALYAIAANIWAVLFIKELYPFEVPAKMAVTLFLFLTVQDKKQLRGLLNVFTSIIAFSAIFGLLIYFFGEPFASIRLLFYADIQQDYDITGAGERIAGLSRSLFHFSYPIATLPILLLMKFRVSKNILYLLFMAMSFVAVLLNGERSSLLFPLLGIMYLVFSWQINIKKIVGTSIIGISFYLIISNLGVFEAKENSFSRIKNASQEQTEFRIVKQFAAVLNVAKNPISGGNQTGYINEMKNLTGYTPGSSSHNSYVRVMENVGLLGVVFLLGFARYLYLLVRETRLLSLYSSENDYYFFQAVIVSLASTMAVAAFHNNGIFLGERTAVLLLGFLLAFNNQLRHSHFEEDYQVTNS